MLVLSVTECPPALRGDLSRWLQQIDTGVYVGQVSHRVREELWKRTVSHLKNGRAVMVFSARNEQKMDFRIHNASWEAIDFDGLKLMLRPSTTRQSSKHPGEGSLPTGYSAAAKTRMMSRSQKSRSASFHFPDQFVIIDLETTGFQPQTHEIIEIGAIKVNSGLEESYFHAFIHQKNPLPDSITQLTGLSDDILHRDGRPLKEVLPELIEYLGNLPIVSHNIAFDLDFLRAACDQFNMPFPGNRRIDTLTMAKQHVKSISNHRLETLMQHFGIAHEDAHRSLPDCRATLALLHKLIEIIETKR